MAAPDCPIPFAKRSQENPITFPPSLDDASGNDGGSCLLIRLISTPSHLISRTSSDLGAAFRQSGQSRNSLPRPVSRSTRKRDASRQSARAHGRQTALVDGSKQKGPRLRLTSANATLFLVSLAEGTGSGSLGPVPVPFDGRCTRSGVSQRNSPDGARASNPQASCSPPSKSRLLPGHDIQETACSSIGHKISSTNGQASQKDPSTHSRFLSSSCSSEADSCG